MKDPQSGPPVSHDFQIGVRSNLVAKFGMEENPSGPKTESG